jgi:hypothetical protein
LVPPTLHLPTELELMDGTRALLPVAKIAHILPDRSGVLVVFDLTDVRPEALIDFAPPDNAAIFNADASLRFRLKNPAGPDGIFGPVVSLSTPGERKLGVRACPKNYPVCESVYVVDGTTDDLSKQLPLWSGTSIGGSIVGVVMSAMGPRQSRHAGGRRPLFSMKVVVSGRPCLGNTGAPMRLGPRHS